MPGKTPPPNHENMDGQIDQSVVPEDFTPSSFLEPETQEEAQQPAVFRTGETLSQDQHCFPRNLDFILDIPLEISVELGRTKVRIADILKLGQGSIIELTNPAGSALEVLVNHKPVAKGEVVVVNEKYGIRLTEILSIMERIEKLK